MPFPIDEKYIKETESELNVKFPTEFKNRMIKSKVVAILLRLIFLRKILAHKTATIHTQDRCAQFDQTKILSGNI